MASTYENYLETPKSLTFDQMRDLHQKLLKEIENDPVGQELYDELFTDENHVLIVYYNNVDWWSWVTGEQVKPMMPDDAVNDLIDEIYLPIDVIGCLLDVMNV